jgi:hypothetical protein
MGNHGRYPASRSEKGALTEFPQGGGNSCASRSRAGGRLNAPVSPGGEEARGHGATTSMRCPACFRERQAMCCITEIRPKGATSRDPSRLQRERRCLSRLIPLRQGWLALPAPLAPAWRGHD